MAGWTWGITYGWLDGRGGGTYWWLDGHGGGTYGWLDGHGVVHMGGWMDMGLVHMGRWKREAFQGLVELTNAAGQATDGAGNQRCHHDRRPLSG